MRALITQTRLHTMSTTSSSSSLSSDVISSVPSQTLSLSANPHISVKLTSTNFLLWKTQLQPLLRLYELHDHVDGTDPAPSTTINDQPNKVYAAWYARDQLVLTWITLSLFESVMPTVINKPTAKAAWDALTRAYGSGSAVQIRQLRSSLHHLSCGSDSIHDYLQRAKALYDQLAAFGSAVDEDDLVSAVLAGLDEKYRPFARNLESKMEPISFENLHSLLLSEELQLRRYQPTTTVAAPTAYYSSYHGGRGRGRGGRGNHGGKSHRGGYGGRSSHPRLPQAFSNPIVSNSQSAGLLGSGPPSPSAIICHNCGGRGHIRPNCPSPLYQPNNHIHPTSGPQTHLAASNPISTSSQQWLMDSGANHHLTSDLDNLAHHSEYNDTDQVTFGNGPPHEG
ncbi:Retrovirus-related Pol polyprotein from transposon RE1 [Linum grandiflorum]